MSRSFVIFLCTLALATFAPGARSTLAAEARQGLVPEVLAACGLAPLRQAAYCVKFQRLADELRASQNVASTARAKAQAIHAFLSRRILCGPYRTDADDLATVLDGGAYNCASSAVLFVALADEFGLPASVVAELGHVWCRVEDGAESLDVETTSAHGFEGLAGPRSPAHGGRVLDRSALVAVFHYNRGVRSLKENRFAAAVLANLAALSLDRKCGPAHDNLCASLNNWAISFQANGHGSLARILLQCAVALKPRSGAPRENLAILSRRQPTAIFPGN